MPFQIGLPYLKAKVQALYESQRGSMLHAAMWGRGDIDQVDGDEIVNQEIMVVPEVTSNQSFKQKMKALLVKSYPWIHSAHEGNFFKMCTRVYFPKERNRINIFFSMMRPNLTKFDQWDQIHISYCMLQP